MAEKFNPTSLLDKYKQPSEEKEEEKFNPTSILNKYVEQSPDIPEELAPPKPKQYDNEAQKQTDEALSFAELSSDEDYISMLREYNEDRFGEDGKQAEDESNEDYLKRFLTHTREFEWNSIDLGRQLDWVRNADEEKRMEFGYLYSQLEKLPSFYEEGGTGYVSALRDFGKSLILDPLNYIGFGAGKVGTFVASRAITQALKQGGKQAAIKEAAKVSGKRLLSSKAGKIAAAGIAVEAGAAGVQNLKQQELEMLSKKYGDATPEEYDLLNAGLTSVIGGGVGFLGAKLSGGLGGEQLLKNAREARIKQKTIAKELNARNKTLAAKEAGERAMDAVTKSATGIFDKDVGKQTLEMLGEAGDSALTDVQFKTELMQRVGHVVTGIVEDLAESGKLGEMVDVDTKASEVIGKIVSDSMQLVEGKSAKEISEQTTKMLTGEGETGKGLLDAISTLDIDGDTLQSAISKAGITPKQFVDAFGSSFSEAGKYLQTASNVGKIMKGIREVDPDLHKAIIGDMNADDIVGPLGKAHQVIQTVDKNRRAFMVTAIPTTVRNIATAGARLTMDTASNLIESTLYQFGRGFDAAMTGNAPVNFSEKISNIVSDSFGRLNRMSNAVGTADLADSLLKHNTNLASRLDRTLQEVGTDESTWKVTRMLNGLNIAQDMFFRKAIFTDAIDKRLRRAGVIVKNPTKIGQYKSLEEFTASGKVLPTKVLQEAVEDSLEFTFSRMPKADKGRAGDTVGHYFIKFNEAIGPVPGPIGTAAFPFARFMVNAIQFQMQYMPTNIVSSGYRYAMAKNTEKLAKAAKDMGNLDLATKQGQKASKALAQARSDFSKGVVGSAALYSAVQYRKDNQDVKFYYAKNDDGSTTDLRPFFPLTPYLALADVIIKVSEQKPIDIKEFLEAFTGAQFRTGASSFVLDNMDELLKSERDEITSERMAEIAGQYVGELFGGFTTPLRVVRDVQAAYDTEAAIVRDGRQTTGIGSDERFTSALSNTVAKDIPGLAKGLPEIESPTREGTIYRQSPLIGQITGARREAKMNPAEAEFSRLGIERYQIAPTTGDKTADAAIKKALGPIVEKEISELVTSDSYLNKTESKKRASLNQYMNMYKARAKQLAIIEAESSKEKSYTPFDRAQYSKLTDLQTKFADEYYRNKYGKSVIEMQEIEPDKNHLKIAIGIGKALAKRAE